MQRIDCDLIGPLGEDEYGFTYILTMIDTFSRWVMAYPLRTATAKEIVRNMIWHFGIFGNSTEFQTDQGSSLVSSLVEEVLQRLEIVHKITVAYSHEENSMVERWNHEVVRYLRALVYDSNTVENWSELLPFAQRICNAEVCQSIGVAPAQVIFGAAVNLDRQVLVPNTDVVPHVGASHQPMSEYVTQLIETQKKAIEYARKVQKEKDDAHLMASGADVTEFPIGSMVTVSYPESLGGGARPPSKLMTRREGPFVVLSHGGPRPRAAPFHRPGPNRPSGARRRKVSPVPTNSKDRKGQDDTDRATNKDKTSHASKLETFRYDASRVDPVSIAAKDKQEYLVEDVLDHRPPYKPKSSTATLEFLVKWVDFDAPTWERWHNLTSNSLCHRYCMTQPSLR